LTFRKGVTSRTIGIRVAKKNGQPNQFFFVQLSSPSPSMALRLDNARVDISES
jgi:hypothetical protein